MSWTTPLFISIGSLLNIPVSIVLDMIIHSYLIPWVGFIGIILIVIGFLFLTGADLILSKSDKHEQKSILSKIILWHWHF